MKTAQMDFWKGQFGVDYTERSIYNVEELNEFFLKEYGVGRHEMNETFLNDLKINRALEVGCNIGNQLRTMQHYGIEELYGVELQWYAIEKSKSLNSHINIIQGTAFDIPYKDNFFDLVYTFGLLIHISPDDLGRAMDEIYRTSNRYIWGMEYYNETLEEVDYRGNTNALWKGNYAQLYLDRFPDLSLVKEKKYKYVRNNNIDQMFLLEKNRSE